MEIQAWLNLGRKLVPQIHKPPTGKGQIKLGSGLVFGRPPTIKRAQKTGCAIRTMTGQLANPVEYQRFTRVCEQNIEAPQFAAIGGALQQKWISIRESLIELAQLIRTARYGQ